MVEVKGLISEIRVNGRERPIGIDDAHPVFSIAFRKDVRAVKSYRVTVETDGEMIWDTGDLADNGYAAVRYDGKPLAPKTVYTVTASVQGLSGEGEDSSATASFETGVMDSGFAAEWIEPEQESAIHEKELSFLGMLAPDETFFNGETRLRESKRLRRTFTLEKLPKQARIYASAHGVYELCINGEPVSDARLAPEYSEYPKILYYQTYDVTSLLKEGENVVAALLGDGWWIGRLGMSGDSCCYGDRLGFFLQMDADGETILTSDESFRCAPSFIRYSDLYIGEKWDMRMKSDDWMQPGFDDADWASCKAVQADKSALVGQPIDPMRVIDTLDAKKIFTTPDGGLEIDFGQVCSGVLSIAFSAKEGAEVSFEHGEVLGRDGNHKSNILGRNKNQKDVVICRDGVQAFEPKFTFHGFRYVRVNGLKKEDIRSAKALVIGSPLRKIGSFSCSNEDLNQLQHCIEWSTISNMMSIPTDCPQREKMGWTGDINIYSPTASFLYDLEAFLGAWLANLRADQYENGQIPVMSPDPPTQVRLQEGMSGENSSSVWGDACIMVPLALYEKYGDVRVLEENFDMMSRWIAYIAEVSSRKPEGYEHFTEAQKARNPYLWTKGYHFGDWLIPSLREEPDGIMKGVAATAPVVGASYYAITLEAYIKICRYLGKTEIAAESEKLLSKVRRAVCEEFVAEDGTVYNGNLQGLYVMILRAHVCEEPLKQKVLDRLVALIRKNGGCLDTGFSSVSYLLDVLYENGRADVAYELLFQTKPPSWLYMVQMGATTMWENWKAILPDGTTTDSSYNHYAFGCVGDFIYRRIGGLYALEPGYRRIRVKPDYACGLNGAEVSYQSPYGEIAVRWKKADGMIDLEADVPNGVTAEICVREYREEVGAGSFRYSFPCGD